MSDFDKIKIKLSFGCGFVHEREDEEFLSDHWSEDDWNSLSDIQKERWLDELWGDWKSNYESGSVWLEDGDDNE